MHASAHGVGLASLTFSGTLLEAAFPAPALGPAPANLDVSDQFRALQGDDPARQVRRQVIQLEVNLATPPKDAADCYLRLQLLSHRLVEPNTINLEGIFGLLPNVVWTTLGPCATDNFEAARYAMAAAGHHPQVLGVDKFPAMTSYVVPSGVRIADAARVRLGAHLAPGTTVMHEGFCNYNAGTLGRSMVEGRISQGVVVEDGADIGGGASIMGTLSGGGRETIRVGARSLLGANAGLGISLGADCVVEAGLYLTAGTKVRFAADAGPQVIKAAQLSGVAGLLYRRDSLTGAVEAIPRKGHGVALNDQLHAQ
jgi:2,3,4,5-tetrahydropyridine-2-carboxylate N-succinyltransferase